MEVSRIPLKKFVFLVAVAKAAVAGASVGLAALGVTDLAFMVAASHWWESVRPDYLINTFAFAGGLIGASAKILRVFWG